MEKEDDYTASLCPSFSSYTGDGLVETAERVRLEYLGESNDDDFEFVNLRSDFEAVGDCDLVFPIFRQNLVSKTSDGDREESPRAAVTTRLRDLFLRDREDPSPLQVYSSSSSDEDEEENNMDGISSEIYRAWTPEKSQNGGWRKSKSTGSSSSTSSRRWRIKDLLKRSYSEGKESLSFLKSNSRNRDESSSKKMKKEEKEKVSAHEKLYLKNKAMKEEEKRRSYLPYKQHLVGLFFFNLHHRYGKTLSSSSSSFLL